MRTNFGELPKGSETYFRFKEWWSREFWTGDGPKGGVECVERGVVGRTKGRGDRKLVRRVYGSEKEEGRKRVR